MELGLHEPGDLPASFVIAFEGSRLCDLTPPSVVDLIGTTSAFLRRAEVFYSP